jgi:hypothetical protein
VSKTTGGHFGSVKTVLSQKTLFLTLKTLVEFTDTILVQALVFIEQPENRTTLLTPLSNRTMQEPESYGARLVEIIVMEHPVKV